MLRRLLVNALTVTLTVVFMLVIAEFAIPHVVTLRNVGTSFTVYDPVMWKRVKPNLRTVRVTPEFTMSFSSNSLGARGPEPKFPIAGPVLFLGDSFTMGYGVSDGEEYPSLVQQELVRRKGERAPYVLNLGMGASGNGFWLKHLAYTAPKFGPRLVVMQVLDNDFPDNLAEGLFALDDNGQLVELPVPAPGLARRMQNLLERIPGVAGSNLVGLVRQALSADAASTPGVPGTPSAGADAGPVASMLEPGDALTLRIVEAAIQRCRQNGWPVVLLSVGLGGGRQAAIREVAAASEVPVLELPSREARPDLYYKVDGHWNAAGNADTARRLMAKLDELKLLEF